MNEISVRAYAKINLHLEVLDKLPNGYHEIDTIMQTVGLYDIIKISITPANERVIEIKSNSQRIPCDNRNLAYRAAELYLESNNISDEITIHISKNIPIAAGLAGGSADAAATLIGLNRLYGERLTRDELCELGAKLGADVPFCIIRGCCVASGIGEILKPIASLPDCKLLICAGGPGVSTKAAYEKLSEQRKNTPRRSSLEMQEALHNADIKEVCRLLHNSFEEVILPTHKQAALIKRTLLQYGASGALMSGSGSAVFGIFLNESKAKAAMNELRKKRFFARICSPFSGSDT